MNDSNKYIILLIYYFSYLSRKENPLAFVQKEQAKTLKWVCLNHIKEISLKKDNLYESIDIFSTSKGKLLLSISALPGTLKAI